MSINGLERTAATGPADEPGDESLGVPSSNSGLGQSKARILTPLGLFLLALVVRALPWPTVLGVKHVYFFGWDAYYHMRRILYSLAQFPAVLDFDPYINFPHGAKPIWPPFFDLAVACLLRPFYRPEGTVTIERMVVWIPPLLGAVTVVALYFLAKRYFGFHVAWTSGLFLSVLSGHFWYSQIGFVDHHVAVSLVSTLLLAVTMGLFRLLSESPIRRGAMLITAAATGVLLAGVLLVWPGSLLHVGLIEVALLLFLMSRPTPTEAARFAGLFALFHAIGLLMVLPFGAASAWPQWGEFSPVVLTRFQPWMFGALTVYGGACAALWRWTAVGRTRRRRVVQAIGIGILILAVSAAAFPELLRDITDPWRWFARQESFQAAVAESQPLFRTPTGWSTQIAELRLSRFLYVFPVYLVALSIWSRGRRDLAAIRLLLWWSVALGIVTLVQRRFFNSFSVVVALAMGWSCVRGYAALPAWLRASPGRRLATKAGLVAVVGFLLWPVFAAYRIPLRNQVAALRGEQPVTEWLMHARARLLVYAAEWLRDNTPPTSGFLDVRRRPEYGVLAHWEQGHVLEYVGRRPTVIDNFGDDLGEENFRLGMAYFEAAEGEAVRILERLKVRYVVAEHLPVRDPAGRQSMTHRLSEDGRGLRHHRLLFETPGDVPKGPPSYRVYEYVRGARVTGQAAPGERVTAQLRQRTNQGRLILFETKTWADRTGAYELVLPYSTRGAPPALRTEAFYVVHSGGQTARLAIDETVVQQGAVVSGADFHPRSR